MTTDSLVPSGGLGGGSIAAIIIAVLVVGGLAAVLLVMLRNRDWDIKRLVPPRAATVFSSENRMSAFSNISYNTGTLGVRRRSVFLSVPSMRADSMKPSLPLAIFLLIFCLLRF